MPVSPRRDPARAPIALAVGSSPCATRRSSEVIEPRPDREASIALLRDAFDMLASEDYELERFFVEVRRATGRPPKARRGGQLCQALIEKLEF